MGKEIYKIYGLCLEDTTEIRYIGVTRNSLKRRLASHYCDISKNNNPHKCNWLKKNRGKVKIILIEGNINNYEEAEEKEIYYISKYNKINKLLNKTPGGNILPRENQYSGIPWNKGLACTYKEKLIRLNKTAKKVYQYDLDGNFIKEFRSIKEASKQTTCSRQQIQKCANLESGYLQSKGFQWRWEKLEKIEKYFNDDAIRILRVKSGKLKSAKSVKIVDNSIEYIFENYKSAAKYFNMKESTILTYCSINKITEKRKYSYNATD